MLGDLTNSKYILRWYTAKDKAFAFSLDADAKKEKTATQHFANSGTLKSSIHVLLLNEKNGSRLMHT